MNYWQYISDFWGLLKNGEEKKIEGFWGGMDAAVEALYYKLFESISALGIDTLLKREWVYWLKVTTFDSWYVGSDIVSVPKLRDGIRIYENEWVEGSDYTVSNGKIVFSDGLEPINKKILFVGDGRLQLDGSVNFTSLVFSWIQSLSDMTAGKLVGWEIDLKYNNDPYAHGVVYFNDNDGQNIRFINNSGEQVSGDNLSVSVRVCKPLYAPWGVKETNKIYSFAKSIGINRSSIKQFDIDRKFDVVKAMMLAFANGITVKNFESALAVALNIPYSTVSGTIESKEYDGTYATVVVSGVEHEFKCSQNEYDLIPSGENIDRFSPFIPGSIKVEYEGSNVNTNVYVCTGSGKNLTADRSVDLLPGHIVEIFNDQGLVDRALVYDVSGANIILHDETGITPNSDGFFYLRGPLPTKDSIVNTNFLSISITYSEYSDSSPVTVDSGIIQDFRRKTRNPRTIWYFTQSSNDTPINPGNNSNNYGDGIYGDAIYG